MATNQIQIFVLIHEDKPSRQMFPSITQGNTLVGHWRESVYSQAQHRLSGLDAIDLILWKLMVPLPVANIDQAVAALGKDLSAVAIEMRPFEDMSDHFPQAPDAKFLHVIVQRPANPPAPTQLPSSPIAEDGIVDDRVAGFLPLVETAINTFLEENIQLPLWEPITCSNAVRSHLVGLKIPKISTESSVPSLLLHNLGQQSHDPQLAKRVERLFAPGFYQRFLCNTSGSGKTRLLLEGLCHHWGIYFTARTQPEGIGSRDLEFTFETLGIPTRLSPLPSENPEAKLKVNQEVTMRHLIRVLYARVLVFRVFLECAARLGGITEQHKGKWLLIQLAPQTVLGRLDIFIPLNDRLREASFSYLSRAIGREQCKIDELLRGSTVFCIMDEAQTAANTFLDFFLSETNPTARRPILREVMCAWTRFFPALIVSGTGISMQDVETVLGSVDAKLNGQKTETITDLGAFDNEEDQRAYWRLYLPEDYLKTKEWQVVTSRVGYWLHGRHRFTATYISLLLQAGLESPHTVLNRFVQLMTHTCPSDHLDDGPLISELDRPRDFDFSGLWTDHELLRQIAGRVFEYIFNGKPRLLASEADQKLVEYGVARFVVNRDIKADEPLALLAATHFFNTRSEWRWQHFLVDGLSTSNESARGIALEQVGAYLLGVAFSSPTPLSDVFTFVGENELANETAELVAINQLDGKVVCNPISILSTSPTYILGYSPRTQKETLDWIKDPQNSVFCFPADKVGPDLILVLKLSNDTVLRVLVQFKTLKTMGPADTGDALRTTDPMQFISQRRHPMKEAGSSRAQKSQSESHFANPGLSQELRDALGVLGQGTEEAGKLSVLRVLISHPATPHAETLANLADTDPSLHLVATVDLVPLAKRLSEDKIAESLKMRLMAATSNRPQRTRNAGDGTEGPSGPGTHRGWQGPDT